MKAMYRIRHPIIQSSLAFAMAVVLCLPGLAGAQEKGSAKGGAQKLMQPIKTVKDLEALEPGDMLAMSCPKCKNITVTYVEPTFKATEAKEKTTLKHLCPGCETTIGVEGHGKAKREVVKHVCTQCGSKNAFCCVLKKGAGPTKGMEEKK